MKEYSVEEIAQMNEKELQNLHGRLHAYFTKLEAGEAKYNREDLVNQKAFVLEEMRRRDMRHKVRDQLDIESLQFLSKSSFPCWLASFPLDKQFLHELQEKLGLEVNEAADNDGLHLTLALFGSLDEIEKLRAALRKLDLPEYSFIVEDIEIFGDDALVLTGKVPDAIQKTIEDFRTQYDATEFSCQFLPHITLGYIADNPFNLLEPDEFDKISGTEIKMSRPVLMVSIEKALETSEVVMELILDDDMIEMVLGEFVDDRIRKRLDEQFIEELDELEELVVVEKMVSISGSSVLINKDSHDIDLIWRMNWDKGFAKIDLRNFLMKFDRAFSNPLSAKFQHISAPTGPSWSYIGLADLVLRFRKPYNVTQIEESSAYKKALADVPGVGAEFVPEDFEGSSIPLPTPDPSQEGKLHRPNGNMRRYCCPECDVHIAVPLSYRREMSCPVCGKVLKAGQNVAKKKPPMTVKLMQAFTAIKSKSGYHIGEFFVGEEKELWRMWAREIVED